MALPADPAGGSLALYLTRAVVLSIVVAALVMLGLPAVLGLGAAHP
jgi:hypothetical protein